MNFHFEHIGFAWLFLLLVPVTALWYAWHRRKLKIIRDLAETPALLKTLLPGYRQGQSSGMLVVFLIAFSCILLALMNPRVVEEKANVTMEGVQVMLAVDVSKSMMATDVAPNRLERARSFALKLVESVGVGRMGVIAFAGEARLQMPPTTDLGAVKQAIQTLQTAVVPLPGTNIEAVLETAHQSLSADVMAYKVMVIVTDGEELEGNALNKAKEYVGSGLQLMVVGVGTENGALLIDPETGQPMLDENDKQVTSRLAGENLSQLAEITGGKYFYLDDIQTTVSNLKNQLDAMENAGLPNTDLVNYYSFAPFLLLVSFALLFWVGLKGLIRFPKFEIIGKLAAAVFCLLPFMGIAQKEAGDLKKGMEQYKLGEFNNASESFKRALQQNPQSIHAKFYLGLSMYQQKDYGNSGSIFEEIASGQVPPSLKADALHNKALCFANQNRLTEAIDLFKESLKIKSGDPSIVKNLQKAIMDLKAQQPPPEKDKDQPNPPMNEEDANRKLQSVLEEERKTRQKMLPRTAGGGFSRNW